MTFDVAVIGAGVVGCAIAMDLARYDLSVALLEANRDIGAATSKANSAILHTGFDAPPGSVEAALVRRGRERFLESGLPVEHTGAIVIAWNEDQMGSLQTIINKAHSNGVTDVVLFDAGEIYRREPHLGPRALGGVFVPGESITCPFTPAITFATTAVLNGVTLMRGARVETAGDRGDHYEIGIHRGNPVRARAVVNSAGLHSDEVDRLFGRQDFSIRPRKGEFIVFDKPARRLLNHILLPVPTVRTKGVLIAPTVFGNVLLGPTAIDVSDKADTAVSHDSIKALLAAAERMLPELLNETVTCTYAGLRAATEHSDYQVRFDPAARYITAGGVRSTGLSAALGISERVTNELIGNFGFNARMKDEWQAYTAPPITEVTARVCEQRERVGQDRAYGEIVCHCELVSRGEIRDALTSRVPAVDIGGVKRRTRALLGRCQGFNCHARITALIDEHAGY